MVVRQVTDCTRRHVKLLGGNRPTTDAAEIDMVTMAITTAITTSMDASIITIIEIGILGPVTRKWMRSTST